MVGSLPADADDACVFGKGGLQVVLMVPGMLTCLETVGRERPGDADDADEAYMFGDDW